jgi:putative phage-type endonuclease
MSKTAVVPVDRQKFIGGSDIAAIMNISPWRTAVELYADKITPRAEGPISKVKRRGHKWEGVVAEMLLDDLRDKGFKVDVLGGNTRYIDQEHPFFAAEIDFEVRINDEPDITNVEIKTVHPFKAHEWGEAGTDEVPIWYTAQAMWGLGVAPGLRKRCIVAPLFGADELKTYEVLRDDETLAGMRAQAFGFWQDNVLARVPPELKELADVNALFKVNDARLPALIADEHLAQVYYNYRAERIAIKASEARCDALEFEMKRAMRDCGELIVGEEVAATWKTRPHSYLDQAALKADYPKIVREYTRKSESRVFVPKKI